MAAEVLETTHGFDGKDIHSRTLYDLSSIGTREANLLIDFLYYYWSCLQCARSQPPLASEFQPEPILHTESRIFTARIDTTAKDPRNFVIHKLVPGSYPGEEPQFSVARFSDLPNNLLINTLLLEYVRCKQWRNPLYHQIDQTFGGVERCYSSLLLPLLDESGAVIQVFYGFRQISGPTRFDLPS